jgi:hypothetical protein
MRNRLDINGEAVHGQLVSSPSRLVKQDAIMRTESYLVVQCLHIFNARDMYEILRHVIEFAIGHCPGGVSIPERRYFQSLSGVQGKITSLKEL